MTTTMVPAVSPGEAPVPSRPAPGLVISGAAAQPISSPVTAATPAMTTYSASRTAATSSGVPPTALSSPTRRAWSAILPPTSTATLAMARIPSSELKIIMTFCSLRMTLLSSQLMDCQVFQVMSEEPASAWPGSASFRFRK